MQQQQQQQQISPRRPRQQQQQCPSSTTTRNPRQRRIKHIVGSVSPAEHPPLPPATNKYQMRASGVLSIRVPSPMNEAAGIVMSSPPTWIGLPMEGAAEKESMSEPSKNSKTTFIKPQQAVPSLESGVSALSNAYLHHKTTREHNQMENTAVIQACHRVPCALALQDFGDVSLPTRPERTKTCSSPAGEIQRPARCSRRTKSPWKQYQNSHAYRSRHRIMKGGNRKNGGRGPTRELNGINSEHPQLELSPSHDARPHTCPKDNNVSDATEQCNNNSHHNKKSSSSSTYMQATLSTVPNPLAKVRGVLEHVISSRGNGEKCKKLRRSARYDTRVQKLMSSLEAYGNQMDIFNNNTKATMPHSSSSISPMHIMNHPSTNSRWDSVNRADSVNADMENGHYYYEPLNWRSIQNLHTKMQRELFEIENYHKNLLDSCTHAARTACTCIT